jgi:1-acyl-sn-glycerol-3-phosphate acyltransferase
MSSIRRSCNGALRLAEARILADVRGSARLTRRRTTCCLRAMRGSWWLRAVGRLVVRLGGWCVEGAIPADVTRAVVIAAPHTSNWDLVLMLAVGFALGVWPSWLGKRELFAPPFGWLMRWLGGIPVERGRRGNLVEQAAARLRAADRLLLVVPPSGTRSRAPHWRSGFYHIARGANVPIVCGFLDYGRRVGGIGPVFAPSADLGADMDRLRAFYRDVRGKYPEHETPVRLSEEDAAA